jgi:hypothetical protein
MAMLALDKPHLWDSVQDSIGGQIAVRTFTE